MCIGLFLIFLAASGLLYISELIEEHAKAAKYYGQRGIYASAVIQIFQISSFIVLLLGHHSLTRASMHNGLPSYNTNDVFNHLSRPLPPKLLQYLAAHQPGIPCLHRILCSRRRGSFRVVLPLLPHDFSIPRASSEIRSRQSNAPSWLQGNCDILWSMRVVGPALPLLEPQR